MWWWALCERVGRLCRYVCCACWLYVGCQVWPSFFFWINSPILAWLIPLSSSLSLSLCCCCSVAASLCQSHFNGTAAAPLFLLVRVGPPLPVMCVCVCVYVLVCLCSRACFVLPKCTVGVIGPQHVACLVALLSSFMSSHFIRSLAGPISLSHLAAFLVDFCAGWPSLCC